MVRTPYGIEGGERAFNGAYAELARDGYIFVHQDIRGKFRSEGDFVMQRPARGSDTKAIDEGTDTHDTIDCFADTTVSGAPCTGPIAQGAAASKYARTRAGRDFAGPRESTYAGAAFFPQPPPLMQQGLAGAYGTYGAARGQCRRCGREGHYESACPQNPYNANRAPTAPAQQQQSGAAVSARWTTTDYTHARASDMHNTTTYTNDTAMGDVRRQDSEGWRCC